MHQILLFFWKKHTPKYTTLLGPTRFLISETFPSEPDFYINEKKILPRGQVKKKYTNGFKSGGNILGQSASKC